MNSRTLIFFSLAVCAGFTVAHQALAAEPGTSVVDTLLVESWLAAGPFETTAPALADSDAVARQALEAIRLLGREIWPAVGVEFDWPGEPQSQRWERREIAGGVLELGESMDRPRYAVAAFWIDVRGFVSCGLELQSAHLLRVLVDGEAVQSKLDAESPEDGDGSQPEEVEGSSSAARYPRGATVSTQLELSPGTHLVLVEALSDPVVDVPWTLAAKVAVDRALRERVILSVTAEHELRPTDLFDVDTPTSLTLSADGKLLAVGMRHPTPNAENGRSWVDIYEVEERALRLSFEGIGEPAGFAWSPVPDDNRFAFVRRKEQKLSLWLADADGAQSRLLLEEVERFGGFRWAPDGRSLFYSIAQEAEKDPDGVKRYRGLTDRWEGSREKSHLYQLSIADGISRRLTAGALSTSLEDIAPQSDRILFSRTMYDDATWPFARTELFELLLNTLELRVVTQASWRLSARYDPSGERLLILASPTAFGGIGRAVPDSVVPNLYDSQLYVLDLENGAVEPITQDFAPSVEEAVWSPRDGHIYARATRDSHRKLFRYDRRKRSWNELETEIEVVDRMSLSANGERIAFEGTSTNTPSKIYVGSLRGRFRPELVWSTDPGRFDRIRFGKIQGFDFNAADGTTIVGHVYYPPDFEPSRRYPAIVYYYGGTSPVTRSFGGRYPKELWAANGYVVYVLQPSGATGFGQEFSARHVNNWGSTVADEIIDGTKAFLVEHPFVDPARVGCIGASYGGFMTQLLVTKGDLFAAAISHAGISSISSYWGEGNWGYIYSAAATAESYPWNRPDLYVQQSPLFAADKIQTPLLLLHGADDDNVPPGESEQLYTALRVLGREVEYVRIGGERHWILSYDNRKLWTSTIIAWFDRWLKGESQWWEHLYAEPDESAKD